MSILCGSGKVKGESCPGKVPGRKVGLSWRACKEVQMCEEAGGGESVLGWVKDSPLTAWLRQVAEIFPAATLP